MNQFTTCRYHALCELNHHIDVGPLLLAVGTVFFLSHEPAAAEQPKTLATYTVGATNMQGASIDAVAFSPDGKYLAFSVEGQVKIWNVALKEVGRTFVDHKGRTQSLAFSPDGKTLASGDTSGTVTLRDMRGRNARITLAANDGNVDKEGQRWEVASVAFSPDGKTVAAGSGCWSGGGSAGGVLGFNPRSTHGGEARLWDVTTGKVVGTVRHKYPVWSVAFAPNGKTVAFVGSLAPLPMEDTEIKFWDLTDKREQSSITTKEYTRYLTFSAEKTLASVGEKSVTLWDVGTKKAIKTVEIFTAGMAIAFTPNGKTLVLGSGLTVVVLDALTGKEKAKLSDPAIAKKSTGVQCLAFSPDGKMLAVGTGGYLLIWDSTKIMQ